MKESMSVQQFDTLLREKLFNEFGTHLEDAGLDQIYRALSLLVRRCLSDRRKKFMAKTYGSNHKQVYYLCMEFLMGRSLKTGLFNLGWNQSAEAVLKNVGVRLEDVYEAEPDAGLGNGGLGRLAACYLDGMASTAIPGMGYSILYEYGIFKQKIIDGWQTEKADNWLPGGEVWLKSHPDQAVEVRFGGTLTESWDAQGYHHVQHQNYTSVLAVPSDMYVSGYDSEGVSQLRLWQAKAPGMDMDSFNRGDYHTAMNAGAAAELISKVLYPNDNHTEGKILRLKQQYFLSAASVADIVQRHLAQYGSLENLPDKVAIQLNDTHPTLAIPELMRLLMDECGFGWEQSFDICRRTFSYTNHTVMSEALEKWDAELFRTTLPRIWSIVAELNRRAQIELEQVFPGDWGKIAYMLPIGDNQVRMANICCYVCNRINGVSQLHSQIIRDSVFHDYYLYAPEKFTNVTNGIAYRRWLLASNPALTAFLCETIGEDFKRDAGALKKLCAYADDSAVLHRLGEIKYHNKEQFANYLRRTTGQKIDPASLFDVQVKRMHEYKRQHLNALHILSEYLWLKEHPQAEFLPKTYIFGAKAAPGYYMAKQMIRMICQLGKLLESDPAVRDKLRIVYLEDYNVTASERLMPASEISEQISLAGTEASGTGNMKFMLNGAITIGTLDGANIEIAHAAGMENEIIFGMRTPEVQQLKQMGYHPEAVLAANDAARQAVDFLQKGWNGQRFEDLVHNLSQSDPYMVLADFTAYQQAQEKARALYAQPEKWNRMSLANIAAAGAFSADRAVLEYARNIWNIPPQSNR